MSATATGIVTTTHTGVAGFQTRVRGRDGG
jgi:hypothetical protein